MEHLFMINSVNFEDAKLIDASPESVHNHDYEELIVGMDGMMDHFIDFKSEQFVSPFISFVTKGKVHRVIPHLKDGKFSIYVIAFKSEFIPDTTFQLYSYYHDHANLHVPQPEAFDRMVALCGMMYNEVRQTVPDYAVIRLLLSTLFTMIESERRKQNQREKYFNTTQPITFKNFLAILEENYRRPEGVDFYAGKLFMSARNLNLICHNILQKSVSEIIETRKLIEAKNLLISTGKTISEIGYELGYNEKAYFTTVFKKKSGLTPSEFREEMGKLIS
jgi:AraC family transcriptional regulator, transcriptional activator of pobA